MLDEPAIAPTLSDQRSTRLAFEQQQLRQVIATVRIDRTDVGIDHPSANCASFPSTVRR